jgi:hypothetical protein
MKKLFIKKIKHWQPNQTEKKDLLHIFQKKCSSNLRCSANSEAQGPHAHVALHAPTSYQHPVDQDPKRRSQSWHLNHTGLGELLDNRVVRKKLADDDDEISIVHNHILFHNLNSIAQFAELCLHNQSSQCAKGETMVGQSSEDDDAVLAPLSLSCLVHAFEGGIGG